MNAEAFWAHVEFGPGCWLWTGGRGGGRGRSYGILRWNGVPTAAHRVAFLASGIELADRQDVHHVCETGLCVRPHPQHLVIVGHGDHSRITHTRDVCKYGHPLYGENLGVVQSGKNIGLRYCRACNRANAAARYRRDHPLR